MSVINTKKVTTPYGTEDECLEIITDIESDGYRLNDVIDLPGTYTFSIWYKSSSTSTLSFSVLGNVEDIQTTTEWKKYAKTIEVSEEKIVANNKIDIIPTLNKAVYLYEGYLVQGDADTSWLPAPEDVDENISTIKSEFTQEADEINMKVTDLDGNMTLISQDIKTIKSSVKDAEGNISEIQQEVGKIQNTVKDVNENMSSVTQKVDSVETEVKNARGDKSSLAVRIDGIHTEVSSSKGEISTLKQTASGLLTRVENAEDDISRIDQKADSIVIEVGQKIDSEIDKTITSVTTEYYVSTSPTSMSGGSWSATAPTWSAGKYIWIRNKFTKDSGSVSYSNPTCITGAPGATGTAGKGIKTVVNYYLASTSGSGVTTSTTGWTTTIQTISASKRYLWNYEKTTYTDDSVTSTTPVIIGVHGENGTNGSNGVGIASVTEYYQVFTSNTTAPTSWTTTPPTMTSTNKYLWNYEKVTYTNGTTKDTDKRVIGVYGDKGATGATGQGIESITVEYYLSTSKATQTGGSWTTAMPTWKTDTYLWIRNKVVYKNPTSTAYTTPYCDSSWEAAKDVANDLKNNYYTKTDIDSQLEITNNSITSTVKEEVSKINVGARNLLLDSNIEISNNSYNIAQYVMTEKMSSGKTYTCTIWGTLGEGKECFGLWLDNGNISLGRLKDNKDGRYSATFTGKNGTLEDSVIYVYTLASTVTVDSKITKIKLENGNKGTDWSPAPEDLLTNDKFDEEIYGEDGIKESITKRESEIKQLSDSISQLVKDENGNSLMTQTSGKWEFNISGINKSINDAKEDIENVKGDVSDANKLIDTLDKQQEALEKKTAVITITTVDGQPAILLGQTDSSFKLRITNTSIDFLDGSTIVAYISNKVLYIEKAVIKNEIQIGEGSGLVLKKRSNGNIGFRWSKGGV